MGCPEMRWRRSLLPRRGRMRKALLPRRRSAAARLFKRDRSPRGRSALLQGIILYVADRRAEENLAAVLWLVGLLEAPLVESPLCLVALAGIPMLRSTAENNNRMAP
eukprot:652323-Heterocapsa_arctica.AAC.1